MELSFPIHIPAGCYAQGLCHGGSESKQEGAVLLKKCYVLQEERKCFLGIYVGIM